MTISLCTLVYKTEPGSLHYLLALITFGRLLKKKQTTLYYWNIMVVYLKKIPVRFVQRVVTGE